MSALVKCLTSLTIKMNNLSISLEILACNKMMALGLQFQFQIVQQAAQSPTEFMEDNVSISVNLSQIICLTSADIFTLRLFQSYNWATAQLRKFANQQKLQCMFLQPWRFQPALFAFAACMLMAAAIASNAIVTQITTSAIFKSQCLKKSTKRERDRMHTMILIVIHRLMRYKAQTR